MKKLRRYAWWLTLFVGFLFGGVVGYAGLVDAQIRDLKRLEVREQAMLRDLTERYARAVQLPARQRQHEEIEATLRPVLPYVEGIEAAAAGTHLGEAWKTADGPALSRLELTTTDDRDLYLAHRFAVGFKASYRDTVALLGRLASVAPALVPTRVVLSSESGGDLDVSAEFEYLTLTTDTGASRKKRQ